MKKIAIALCMTSVILFAKPIHATAQSGYEFYFFSINLKSFQDSHWLKLTAGAVASVLVHELGHALYLQSQGKNWKLRSSSSHGLAIHTPDPLTENQCRNFGRAGFVLQTFIGTMLTTFENTKYADFTKGWAGMNAFQASSYKGRNHDIGGDFEMIDNGGGKGDLELGVFYLMSSYNLLKMDLPAQLPYFSTATDDGTWLKTFLTCKNHSDQSMLSSTDKPTWLGKEDLIFNQNIDRVAYKNDSEILSAYGNNSRLLATVRNNLKAEIINF